MKKLFSILLVVVVAKGLFAQAKTIEIQKVPKNVKEFEDIRNKLASTPEGGAAMMVLAMLVFAEDENEGLKCMTVALDRENLTQGDVYKELQPLPSYFNYHLDRFRQRKYWPKAYIQGTSPQNGYAYSEPIRFVISRTKYSGDEASGNLKVFIKVYGFSPRPIKMVRNNKGIWKAQELSSLFLDVEPPVVEVNDDL